MRCLARFGTICTFKKAGKAPTEEVYFSQRCRPKSNTPPWVLFTVFNLKKKKRKNDRNHFHMWFATKFCQRPKFEKKIISGTVSFLYPLITSWDIEREHWPEMA